MKATLIATAGVLVMGAAPVVAQDGHVSQSTLSALGLGGMQVLSEEDGLQVRGEGHRSDSLRFIARSSAKVRVIDRKHSSKVVVKARAKVVVKNTSKGHHSPHKGYDSPSKGHYSPHKGGYGSPSKGQFSPHKGGYGSPSKGQYSPHKSYGSPSKGHHSPSKHFGSGSSSIAIAKVSVGKLHVSAFAFAAAGGFGRIR